MSNTDGTHNESAQRQLPSERPSGHIEASRTNVDWLYEQLPLLVERGVLSEAAAEEIRTLYRPTARRNWSDLVIPIMSVLGAILVGGGIILLVAHNWDTFPKLLKLSCSFVPLVLGLGLCGWVSTKRGQSTAWREGSAVFLACAVAANIALIGQIYHLSSGLERYLLTVSLLLFPLIYLMRSHLAAALYLCGILSWLLSVTGNEEYVRSLGVWGLFGLYVPWLYCTIRRRIEPGLQNVQVSLAAVGIGVLVFATTVPGIEVLWVPVALSLSVIYLFLGETWLRTRADQRNFVRTLGYAGLLFCSFYLSFLYSGIWERMNRVEDVFRQQGIGAVDDVIVYLSLAVTLLWVLVRSFSMRELMLKVIAIAPVFCLTGQLMFAATGSIYPPFLLMNGYVLLLGGAFIYRGSVTNSMKSATFGSGLISLLLIVQFFEIHLSFLERGVGFVVVGVLFLLVTRMLSNSIGSGETPAGTGEAYNE